MIDRLTDQIEAEKACEEINKNMPVIEIRDGITGELVGTAQGEVRPLTIDDLPGEPSVIEGETIELTVRKVK